MATNKYITNIVPTIAPRLPAAPTQYDSRFIEQYSNILRLYFNGIDTTFGGILGQPNAINGQPPGGVYLAYPYAAVRRTTNLTFTINTPTVINFDTNDYISNCTNSGTGTIKVNSAGVYNYAYSLQWSSGDSNPDVVYTWLRINGTDVVGSARKSNVPAKNGSVNGYTNDAANFDIQLNAGDNVALVVVSPSTSCFLEADATQASPWVMPSIPAAVATLSFVSSIPT